MQKLTSNCLTHQSITQSCASDAISTQLKKNLSATFVLLMAMIICSLRRLRDVITVPFSVGITSGEVLYDMLSGVRQMLD